MVQAGAAGGCEDLGAVSLCNKQALLAPLPAILCQSQANLTTMFSCFSPDLQLYKFPLLGTFSDLIEHIEEPPTTEMLCCPTGGGAAIWLLHLSF